MSSNYQFFIQGKEKEKKFAELFKNTEPSTAKEDRQEHWDLKIISKVDVKGLKKIDRSNNDYNEYWHWVELKNIGGNEGWLFGKADCFAFETFNYWIIVNKEDLQNFVSENIDFEHILTEKAPYKLYQRKDRKDMITLVNSIDLCHLATTIIKKTDTFVKKAL